MELTIKYMEEKFDLYNEKYFYGLLKKPFFTIKNTARQLGCMNWKNGIYTISISKYYERNEFQYDNTLIHEMIHLYIRQQNIPDNGSHGRRFKAECARINKDGWNLSRTTSTEGWKIAKDAKIRKKSDIYYIIVYKETENTQFLFKVSKPNLRMFLTHIKDKCKKDCKFFETNDKLFENLPSCRRLIRGKRLYGNEIEYKKYMF